MSKMAETLNSPTGYFPCIKPLSQTLHDLADGSVYTTTAQSGVKLLMVLSGTAGAFCQITSGGNPVPQSGFWFPANSVAYFAVEAGWKIGFQQTGGATKMSVIEGA
jgi:hypothetical protein